MPPEVDATPQDNKPIYKKVCQSVVKFNTTSGIQNLLTPGIIVKSGDDYCYIIAYWDKDFQSLPSEVILPGGTKIKLRKQDVKKRLNFVGFYVTTSSRMRPVDFGEVVSMNEEVFSFDFNYFLPDTCNMPHGRVTCERMFEFSHDSPPGKLTAFGGLVFNKKSEFVGISIKDRGVTIAMNVQSIRGVLAMFHEDMMGRPLGEILQHIDDQASLKKRKRDDQAKSRKKRR